MRGDGAQELAAELRERGVEAVDVMLVLGSGLGSFADSLAEPLVVPGSELGALPRSAVPGHAGRLVCGEIAGVRALVQQGRVHLYEGWSATEVTRTVRAAALLGARVAVLTNAAGSLHADWPSPSLMAIADQIGLQGSAPLSAGGGGVARIYDGELLARLEEAASVVGVDLRRGVYAALLGPAYETPAEIRMLARMGADAVGMSTAAEAVAARSVGMRVAGVSCLTNHAAGITSEELLHADVVKAADLAAEGFVALLTDFVPRAAALCGPRHA